MARGVWRHQRSNQNPYIEDGQTTQFYQYQQDEQSHFIWNELIENTKHKDHDMDYVNVNVSHFTIQRTVDFHFICDQ